MMTFVSISPQLSFTSRAWQLPGNSSSCRPYRQKATLTSSITLPQYPSYVNPSEWDLRLGSPAKINLFLRITAKRPDGFHELASLFQSISLHDTLYFSAEKTNSAQIDTLICDTPGVPTDSSNLVLKAVKKFRERTGTNTFFRILLDKSIPHEAGLGGGSSNAATALWAANELTGRPCNSQQLAEFGAEFGSDISFFLSSGTAYCTGRGEIMEDVPSLGETSLFIVKPTAGLSTGLVFKNLKIAECSKAEPRDLLNRMQADADSAEFVNDLEKPSFAIMPSLQDLKDRLYDEGFKTVLMSGSGTSFFCLGQPEDKEKFMSEFSTQNDVRIFTSNFHSRPSADRWYFEPIPVVAKK